MVTVINCGISNIKSVENTFRFLERPPVIADIIRPFSDNELLVLPGVGAYQAGMNALITSGWDDVIRSHIKNGSPFLGICLGFQLLFDTSYELGKTPGLGIFEGEITQFSDSNKKVPHMGWNALKIQQDTNHCFSGLAPDPYVYFVHSFYLKSEGRDFESATCTYGDETCVAAIQTPNLLATQFHPEKSGDVGLEILANFVRQFSSP